MSIRLGAFANQDSHRHIAHTLAMQTLTWVYRWVIQKVLLLSVWVCSMEQLTLLVARHTVFRF
uniref:hypothetical protein n=1 Tax=Photobacterium kishitanii TaxID=318456 RepID=UPI0015E74D06|nr:hypothetical protein [Photobacterium kishitanii]